MSTRESPAEPAAPGSLNPLRQALAEGRATLGYLVSMPSVQLVQALARTGVDWPSPSGASRSRRTRPAR